jgi:hypothetical protein
MTIATFNSIKQSVRNELENSLTQNLFWIHLASLLPSTAATAATAGTASTAATDGTRQEQPLHAALLSALQEITMQV